MHPKLLQSLGGIICPLFNFPFSNAQQNICKKKKKNRCDTSLSFRAVRCQSVSQFPRMQDYATTILTSTFVKVLKMRWRYNTCPF